MSGWRRALAAAWYRLRTLAAGRRREREVDEELRFHLDMTVAQNVARGMSEREARRAALLELGGLEQVREACRDERGIPWLETTGRDLVVAGRVLRRETGLAVAVVATLALAIGAVTSIYPVVHAVLLAPLPFAQPDRLVALWESNAERGWDRANASPANLLDWRHRATSFTGLTGHSYTSGWALRGAGEAERVAGVEVVGDFFTVLGAELAMGRDIRREENWMDEEGSLVISHDLWRGRFGGDRGVLGRRIDLNGDPFTIVGVAPPGFAHPATALDVWVAYRWHRSFVAQPWFRFAHFIRPLARLRPGVTAEQASRELATLAAELEREHPESNRGYAAGATPLHEWIVGDSRRPLLVLLAAVGLLLLVACANVAALLLARSAARARNIAVRSALGAPRSRLLRQLLTESLLLASLGGAAGIALGAAGLRLLVALAGDSLPRAEVVHLDPAVLLVCLAIALATGVVFGVGPALRVTNVPAAAALRRQTRSVAGGSALSRGRAVLVAAEVAVATVLLAGAGLALRSFAELLRVDPGFSAEGRVAASFDLPDARYPEPARVVAHQRQLLARARDLPGVRSAALASSLPLEGQRWNNDFTVAGRPQEPGIDFARRIVSGGYFDAMGVRLLRGRGFVPADDERSRGVAVVNEVLARRFFAGGEPVGQQIAFGREPTDDAVWREIVGVVAEEKIDGLAGRQKMEIYIPHGQELLEYPDLPLRNPTVVMHVEGADPTAAIPGLRQRLRELDPEMPLYDVRTLEDMLAEASSRERLLMVLLGLFALVALVLATVGVAGLVAFAVNQRRREIGVRLALGAGAAAVVRAVAGRVAALFLAGLLVGLAAAAVSTRALGGILHGVAPGDPPTLALAGAVLGIAAVLAAWLPTRRAVRLDPLEVLRAE